MARSLLTAAGTTLLSATVALGCGGASATAAGDAPDGAPDDDPVGEDPAPLDDSGPTLRRALRASEPDDTLADTLAEVLREVADDPAALQTALASARANLARKRGDPAPDGRARPGARVGIDPRSAPGLPWGDAPGRGSRGSR